MSSEKMHGSQDDHSHSSIEKGGVKTTVVSGREGLTGDDEIQAFARKDVSWTKEEEKALVWKLGESSLSLYSCLRFLNEPVRSTNYSTCDSPLSVQFRRVRAIHPSGLWIPPDSCFYATE
jgi:hypothetical protein